jgi:O-antigen/teichoic acid export membrane protein
LTLGQEPFRLTSFVESLIIIHWLNDFPTWLGIRDLLQNRMTWLYWFAWGFYQSLVPALSEALGAGKRRLAQYYIARYFQFAFLFSAAIFSLLMAVGPTFISGAMGPQWAQANKYLWLAALCGLLLPPAFLSDSLQQGAGRPGTQALVMLAEQAVRLFLFVLLIPTMQFPGIYAATLIALGFKAVLAWTLNHRSILPLRLPPWVTLGAPACAGALNSVLWSTVTRLCAPGHTGSVLTLFFVAGAGSFFACFFACGLFGGFDPTALEELDEAARMSSLVRPLCLLLSGCARIGARLSPIGAAPLSLATEARAEAAALDQISSGAK